MTRNHLTHGTAVIATLGFATMAMADTIVTFDSGAEGWSVAGMSIPTTGGNPGANLRTVNPDTFGMTFSNTTNTEFITDYTQFGSVTLSIDTRVDELSFFGSPVSRPWLVELRDVDSAQGGYPYSSVWYKFTNISAGGTANWTTFSVTIDDPNSTTLPAGWGGYGDETPLAEPILPPGVTFADILAGVDEIVFTTFEPGFFFGFTAFDMRVDNITIETDGGTPPCETDTDGSGGTDVDDLVNIILDWGICVGCSSDVTGDNRVNVDDLVAVILGWGPCPTK